MQNPALRVQGYIFAAVGGLFALMGGIMLLMQIGFTGEWMFTAEENGRQLTRPAGIEFASMFASLGSAFFFIGIADAAGTARQRAVRNGLAGASFVMVAASALAMMLTLSGGPDIGWGVIVFWPLVLAIGYALATQHSSYRHGEDLDRRAKNSLQDRYPVGQSIGAPPHETAPIAANVPPIAASASPTAPRVTSAVLTRAAIAGGILACFPLVFFGLFAVVVGQQAKAPAAGWFLGGFALIAVLFFGAIGFDFALLVQLMGTFTGGTLSGAYAGFAGQVGGELIEKTIPLLGTKSPIAVVFTHRESPAVLDIQTESTGPDDAVNYMRLTIELPQNPGFKCQISPQGILSVFGPMLGFQDVQLGWEFFDDLFVVKAGDEQRIREVIDRPVQEQIMAVREFAQQHQPTKFGSGYSDLTIDANRVQIRIRCYLTREQDVAEYYRVAGQLYDLLAARLKTS